MTTKSKHQNSSTSITPYSNFSVAPHAPTSGELTKSQEKMEEQKNTQLHQMEWYTEKAAYASRALPYVADVAASCYTQSAVYATQLNDSVSGTECHDQVREFNYVNMRILKENLHAIGDGHGNAMYNKVKEGFKEVEEKEKKRGWFGR